MSDQKAIAESSPGFLTAPGFDLEQKSFVGCGYDANFQRIDQSLRGSHQTVVDPIDPKGLRRALWWRRKFATFGRNPVPLRLRGTTVYLGHYTEHFGHWLLESLGRLWDPDVIARADHLVFHPFLHPSPAGPADYGPMKWVIEALNLRPERIRLLHRAAICETLLVPKPLVLINEKATPEAGPFYRRLRDSAVSGLDPGRDTARKLLISRMGSPNRDWARDQELEEVAAAKGFEIVTPQDLPFVEQVRLFAQAETIVGRAGSGLHNIVFSRTGTRCLCLGGGTENLRNQRIAAEISGALHQECELPGEEIDLAAWFDGQVASS